MRPSGDQTEIKTEGDDNDVDIVRSRALIVCMSWVRNVYGTP